MRVARGMGSHGPSFQTTGLNKEAGNDGPLLGRGGSTAGVRVTGWRANKYMRIILIYRHNSPAKDSAAAK